MTLPSLVQRYLERSLSGQAALPARIHVRQAGEMQLKPGRWRPFEARQEVSVEHVEFSWRARFPLAPLIALRVHDWYRAGEGELAVNLWRLPLKGVRGPDVTKGEAMRYLAELPLFPHALAGNRELEWHEVGASTVEVSAELASERVAVRLHFDAAGDIVASSADARPRAVGSVAVDTPFRGKFGDFQALGGVRMPTTLEATWLLDEGPFAYFRGRVTAFELASQPPSSRPSASA